MAEKKIKSQKPEKKEVRNAKSQAEPIKKKVNLEVWSFENPVTSILKGNKLRIETGVPAVIHWSADEWKTMEDTPTSENGQGKHISDLGVNKRKEGNILFTFYWPDAQRWENRDFEVHLTHG